MRISDWSSDVCSSDLFAAVARISDINLGLYRSFLQPWIRAAVTPQSAEWMQRMNPLRLPYELISDRNPWVARSEEHTSELQSLMRISYAVFCLKNKKNKTTPQTI